MASDDSPSSNAIQIRPLIVCNFTDKLVFTCMKYNPILTLFLCWPTHKNVCKLPYGLWAPDSFGFDRNSNYDDRVWAERYFLFCFLLVNGRQFVFRDNFFFSPITDRLTDIALKIVLGAQKIGSNYNWDAKKKHSVGWEKNMILCVCVLKVTSVQWEASPPPNNWKWISAFASSVVQLSIWFVIKTTHFGSSQCQMWLVIINYWCDSVCHMGRRDEPKHSDWGVHDICIFIFQSWCQCASKMNGNEFGTRWLSDQRYSSQMH